MTSQKNSPSPVFRTPFDTSSQQNVFKTILRHDKMSSASPLPAKVVAVHGGGADLVGMVDIVIMVHMQTPDGQSVPHNTIYNVPYLRYQGGLSAIIIDPQPGDIGQLIINGRDISNVKAARDSAPPGSWRMNDFTDCVYLPGILNGAPNQYIQATEQGWRIVTPGTVEIQASGITANCDIVTSGDVVAGGVSLKSHTHSGVQSGGSNTGKPQ